MTLPDVAEHPILGGFSDALQLVRATQTGTTYTPRFDTQVFPIEIKRPVELLGHLAITRFPRLLEGDDYPVDTVPVSGPSAHVAWMRHDAELVVRYDARTPIDNRLIHWAAVFKPEAEQDDNFALAEPPAHDDWVPQSIDNRTTRSRVNVAITRMRDQVTKHLTLAPERGAETKDARSVAVLADALSKLIGSVPGSKPTPKSSPRRKSQETRAKKPQVEVTDIRFGRVDEYGYRTDVFTVEIRDATVPIEVTAYAAALTEAGRLNDDDLVSVVGWGTDPRPMDGARHVIAAGRTATVRVKTYRDTTLDLRFDAEAAN
ncbi:hypothetical protein [Serinicoccus sp. CNJ-927]|uniref:hypothetical protein n=1 Tax=Serinicoccus sp. CNJ-927 TaxID=1904970 RepID=UPI00117A3EEA|nr:hypothetical protein [Serinicoccus sp. CNJ-927]